MTPNDLMNVDLNPLAHPAVTDTLTNEGFWLIIAGIVVINVGLAVLVGAYELWDAPRAELRRKVDWARIGINSLRVAAYPTDGWPPRRGAVEEFEADHALLMKHDRAYRKAQLPAATPAVVAARIEPTLTRKGH